MRCLLTAATAPEIAPLQNYLGEHFVSGPHPGLYQQQDLYVQLLFTGVGLPAAMHAHTKALAQQPFDLLLNAGIAGAWDRNLAIGTVVQVITESFGDLGVEEQDGNFTDLFALGLADPAAFPFQEGLLHNPQVEYAFLPTVSGSTVNRVHGSASSIAQFRQRSMAQVETMEGAAAFFAALHEGIPFLQIRAISNYVEPRNRSNWNIPLAIANLNQVLVQMLQLLQGS